MAGTLYGLPLSPNVNRVKVVANELNIHLNFKFVDLRKGEHKQEAFLALNPFGSIPAYVSDDGVTLFESRAIGKYIDIKSGGKLLHIKDPRTYGLVENWSYVEESAWSKNAQTIFFELFVKPNIMKASADQPAVDAAKAKLVQTLQIYEKHFSTAQSTFIVGNELSIADLFHIPFVAPLVSGPHPLVPDLLVPFPLVKAWFDKLLALPSWKAVEKDIGEFLAQIAKA